MQHTKQSKHIHENCKSNKQIKHLQPHKTKQSNRVTDTQRNTHTTKQCKQAKKTHTKNEEHLYTHTKTQKTQHKSTIRTHTQRKTHRTHKEHTAMKHTQRTHEKQ